MIYAAAPGGATGSATMTDLLLSPYPLRTSMVLPLVAALSVGLAACASSAPMGEESADTMAAVPVAAAQASTPPPAEATMVRADAQMQAVLDQLAALGAKPIETLTPEQARQQPSPADAVKAVIKARGDTPTAEVVGNVQDRTFPGPGGPVPIRIYTPEGASAGAARPVVHYIHGGGWVIANLDTYDASARALANEANAIVVSTHYRQGPENKFPAAHEDSLAAYQWIVDNAAQFGGDPQRIAVVGESAGGNLAANIAIAARDQGWQAPVHQVLVYPVANNDMNSESYIENANAKPLSKAAMQWFVEHAFSAPTETADPRIALAKRTDLAGVAPATIILAQIDPLRSDGEAYAQALRAAGVPVTLQQYDGVTHEFFGMAAVVDKAKQAQQLAGEQLKAAFAQPPTASE